MAGLPITRIVLYKHGVGYFEREGLVEGDTTVALTFKQAEVSDVLKSLTVLDLEGGHIASVSYDSTKPLEQLLAEVALTIPDQGSLIGLLPQLKGARIIVEPAGADYQGEEEEEGFDDEPEGEQEYEEDGDYDQEEDSGEEPEEEPERLEIEGIILGIDTTERQTADGVVKVPLLSLLTDVGEVCSFDLYHLARLQILDEALRRDLDFYLRTHLSAKKKDARTFTFFAQGQGLRTVRISYTLEAPVWKATYRILLGEENKPPMIQGWAVVDNTQDEDWEDVQLLLVAGLPVSFVHDLYTPRYIRRPVVKVQETTGVLPPEVEAGIEAYLLEEADTAVRGLAAAGSVAPTARMHLARGQPVDMQLRSAVSSTPAQVRERQLGDLFEYQIEHPVTIRRNQSALVPIVLRSFKGRPVLLYNKETRAENPMRCVEFKNTTGLTLEGGPVTVLEGGSYVGEAMLDTLQPDEQRLVPYAVELAAHVLDNVDSHDDRVHRVVIRRGQMITEYTQVQQTTYTLHNKSETEQTIYLDHRRQAKDWQLFDTPEPQEVTENFWRFKLLLPARKATTFVIRQRHLLQRGYSLADIGDQTLAFWLQKRYLDGKTEEILKQVFELRRQAAGLEDELKRLHQERATLHGEQQRIRENLQALGDRSAEKELRERFVRALQTQEDRLEQIDKEIRERTAARDNCREQLSAQLAGLEYEAAV